MSYSKIEIFGGCDVNYLNIKRGINTNDEISSEIAKGVYTPSWELDTLMLASYQDSINVTPLSVPSNGAVVGYHIQRYDIKQQTMRNVIQESTTLKIQDYNVNGNNAYQYYIFPIIETDGVRTLGAPILANEIEPSWQMCTIVGLIETDVANEYMVDKNNVWKMYLNTELDDFTLNIDKQFTDGFSRFPKRTQGTKQYVSSGAKSILGTLDCASDKISNTIHDIEKWESFCYSPNLKLFNDMRGRIIPMDIQSVSTGYLTQAVDDSPLVTSIKYTQLASADAISVYGLDGV